MRSLDLNQALDGLYEAAATPDAWSDALQEFARAANAVGCLFYPERPDRIGLNFPISPEIGSFMQDFAVEGWWTHDHRAIRGWPLLKAGRPVVVEHDVASNDERKSLPYYRDLLSRHDLPWWASLGFSADGQDWGFPILRSSTQGAFTATEVEELALAAPHLARMVSLASKLALAQGRGALDALERIGLAAFVLDRTGRVVIANAPADNMMNSVFTTMHGRLQAADAASERRLRSLVDRAILPRTAAAPALPTVFVARREGRPYMVEGWSATGWMRDVFGHIAALIVVTDLNARPQQAEKLIGEAFKLSPRETRLACALASGDELRAAAERVGITYETARAYLKTIFAKAGVTRQSELVSVLSALRVWRKDGA